MATHRDQRRLVHLDCQYRAGENAWAPAVICNISAQGLMIKCPEPPGKGLPLEINLNGYVMSGEVAWALGGRFGLRGTGQIDLRAVQEISRESSVGRRFLPRVAVRVPGELVLGDEAFTVLLTEISQHGARLHMPVPPAGGSRGLLCWSGNERLCSVLWAGADCLGVSFDVDLADSDVIGARTTGRRAGLLINGPVWSTPLLPPHVRAGVLADRRRGRRSDLRLDCEVRQGDDPWLGVTLENVSREGFRLAWFAGCQIAKPLVLRLPDGTLLEAGIDRHDDYRIVCRFTRELDQAVFDSMTVD
jgi:hypothetical protein